MSINGIQGERVMYTMLEKLQHVDVVFVTIAQLFTTTTRKQQSITKIYAMVLSSIRKIWSYIDHEKQTRIYHTIKEYEKMILLYEESKDQARQEYSALNHEVLLSQEIVLATSWIQVIAGISLISSCITTTFFI